MNKIEVKGIEYDLISNWDEVNLETFNKLVTESSQDSTGFNKLLSIITILSGIPIDLLRKASIDSIKNIDIKWVFEPITTEISKTITVNGKRYGIVKDFSTLTLGEYADLDAVTSEEGTKYQNMHKLCAILYRPIVSETEDNYEILDYDWDIVNNLGDEFLCELPISVINPVVAFFLNIKQQY